METWCRLKGNCWELHGIQRFFEWLPPYIGIPLALTVLLAAGVFITWAMFTYDEDEHDEPKRKR